MAVNPYIVLDLMKPMDVFTDLTPNFQGRVGDSQSIIKVWFKMNGLPYDLRKKEVEFVGIDPNGKMKSVTSTIGDRTTGDNIGLGRVSFVFPAGVFAATGYWDEDNTFFRVKEADTGEVISTINVKLNVLDNQVEMGVTDDDIISRIDQIAQEGQDAVDKVKNDLLNSSANVRQELEALQATEDSIKSVLANQDVATKNYVRQFHAGDLLGTAQITPNTNTLHPYVHIFCYSYGAGVAQTSVDEAGGSAVYECIGRLVYITPELVQVYASTEQLKNLAPNWSMTSSPDVTTNGTNEFYLTSGVNSLMVRFEGTDKVGSFTTESSFVVA